MSHHFQLDSRSAKNLQGILPNVRDLAISLLAKAQIVEIDAKIISGLRTFEEQDRIYAQGRTTPGKIVTTKAGGYSNHNFGIAFDIGIFNGKDYLEESPLYKSVGKIGRSLGLTWGGDWKEFADEPHFELRPAWASDLDSDNYLAELRRRAENNEDFFA